MNEALYTLDEIGWNEYSPEIQRIAKALNVSRNFTAPDPQGSVMNMGEVCDCDSGFLCEHRLIWILNNVDELVASVDMVPYSLEDN